MFLSLQYSIIFLFSSIYFITNLSTSNSTTKLAHDFHNFEQHSTNKWQSHPIRRFRPIEALQRHQLIKYFSSQKGLKPLSGVEMVLLNLLDLQKQVLNMNANGTEATSTTELLAEDAVTMQMIINTVSMADNATMHEQLQGGLPTFELILGTFTYLLIIGITILGNTLVILAVFNYKPLKKVQNYFIVSLAASDMLVALAVMPLHVVKFLANGRWLLGVTVCQLFTTADILLCTSSILNLCAIAIDRYWAIHDPIGYAQKRSLKLVCGMIVLVWVTSAVISVPPLIGWNDWTSQTLVDHCELTSEKAFVVFSACGSFFLPLLVMVVVYVKIFLNARKRIRKNRGRSALFKMSEELQNDKKHKRTHRVPVAATSVIALASATGAQIFRKRSNQRRRKSAPYRSHNGIMSTSTTFSTCIWHQNQPLHVPRIEDMLQPETSGEGDPDSGHGGSSKDSPETSTLPPPHPTPPAISPLSKRFSLAPLSMEPSMLALTSSASLTAMPPSAERSPSSEKSPVTFAENGGERVPEPQRSPETVELKTHLKEREKISVAKEKRAAKTIAVIIFVFTFCWLPFFCVYVIMPFCPNCYLHPKVHQAFVWLGYINSSLNPFLYGILNLEFRRAFRKILCPSRVLNAQRRRLSEQMTVRKKSSAPK